MLALVLVVLTAVAELFPETAIGQVLRRWLIELPARKLAELNFARVALAAALFVAIMALIAVTKADGALVVAQGLPEGLAWLAAGDTAVYAELAAAALLVRAAAGFQVTLRAARLLAARTGRRALAFFRKPQRGRAYAARTRVQRPRRIGRSRDDEDRLAPAFAIA